jgi:hypothetical protein
VRKLYIENGMAFWVDKEGDHIYHAATEADLCARIRDAESIIGDISGDIHIFKNEMRERIAAFLGSPASGEAKHE